MSFSFVEFDEGNQARLREIAGVSVDSVESVEEALLRKGPVPFLGTLYDGSQSDGRLVAQNTGQMRRVRLVVIAVAEHWGKRVRGKTTVLELLRAAEDIIVTRGAAKGEWQNPQCKTPFVFDEDSFMQRAGQRVAYQAEFHADVYDDFTP